MDEKTINQLANLISDRWNKASPIDDIKKEINATLKHKKIADVIKEYKDFLLTFPDSKKNQIPIMTTILVLALCRRNLDDEENIYLALRDCNLIGPLYGGISILLNGTSQQIAIQSKWQDDLFANKYEFINRFQGQFLYWEYIELFIAAGIIRRYSSDLFEDLMLKDKTYLLLFNLASGHLEGDPSDRLILSLINRQDELDQNIGFFLLTSRLNHYMFRIKQMERNQELGIESTNQPVEILTKEMMIEVGRAQRLLLNCKDSIKVSLIINYLLSEPSIFPKVFATLLLKPALKDYLVDEIRNSTKLNTLDKVYYVLEVVSSTRVRKEAVKYPKIEIYNALTDVIISFIREGKGIYQWTSREEGFMQEISNLLPKRAKNKLLKFLTNESKGLLCTRLDKLIRFDIFLKDKPRQDIINGMINIIQASLNLGV